MGSQNFICLIAILLSVQLKFETVFALSQCGEFHKNEVVQRRKSQIERKLEFSDELEIFFDAYMQNDTLVMDDILKTLGSMHIDDDDDRKSVSQRSPVKSVVN